MGNLISILTRLLSYVISSFSLLTMSPTLKKESEGVKISIITDAHLRWGFMFW